MKYDDRYKGKVWVCSLLFSVGVTSPLLFSSREGLFCTECILDDRLNVGGWGGEREFCWFVLLKSGTNVSLL